MHRTYFIKSGFMVLAALLCVSKAARWVDIGDHIQRTISLQASTGVKRSSALAVREVVEADDGEDLTEVDSGETAEGENITRYKETYKGIEVYDAYVSIDTDKNTGEYTGRAAGNVLRGIADDITSVVPKLSDIEALEIAKQSQFRSESAKIAVVKNRLIIYMKNNKAILSYKVSLLARVGGKLQRPVVVLDANSGDIIHVMSKATSFAYESVGGNEKIGKYRYGDDQPYLEIEKKGDNCILESENVQVIHLNHTEEPSEETPFTFKCKTGFNDEINGAYSQLSDAFFFAENVFKMYKKLLKKPPVTTTPVKIWVHYGVNAVEASWSGLYVVFGDGNPSYIYPLISADVFAHELGHAFTEDHSDINYYNQPGAINEAFSDLSGEAFEYFLRGNIDYIAGGDISKFGIGSRDLCDQSVDGHSVTHVDDYHDSMDVHYSSGIFNKVSCLIAKSSGFDMSITFQIFAHANRFYWHEESNFTDAACGVMKAAYDIGYNTDVVRDAFSEVGIDACAIDNHVRLVPESSSLGGLSANEGQTLMLKLDLSNVRWNQGLQVLTLGGSGDVDLYVGRRSSFKMVKAKFSSERNGNLEVLTIPRKKFPKGYCFIRLVPKQVSDKSFFSDVTLTTSVMQ